MNKLLEESVNAFAAGDFQLVGSLSVHYGIQSLLCGICRHWIKPKSPVGRRDCCASRENRPL